MEFLFHFQILESAFRLINTHLHPLHSIYNKKREALLLVSVCGQRWIRTTEVERQQIYSLPHLATLEFAQTAFPLKGAAKVQLFFESASTIVHKMQIVLLYFSF